MTIRIRDGLRVVRHWFAIGNGTEESPFIPLVASENQTTNVLNVPFLKTQGPVTLASDTTVGSRTITLTGGHGTLIGEIIELADSVDNNLFMQSQVLNVVTDTITLDQPVNRVYTASGTTVVRSSKNLLVDGSTTPVIFSVLPLLGQEGDMIRVILQMRSNDDMDFESFGSDVALINGCVLRVKLGDGTFKNLFNFKSNGDWIEQSHDSLFFAPKVGNAVRGFTSRLTWGGPDKHGVAIRLRGSVGEELQLIIQDDLTLLSTTFFSLMGEGHQLPE